MQNRILRTIFFFTPIFLALYISLSQNFPLFDILSFTKKGIKVWFVRFAVSVALRFAVWNTRWLSKECLWPDPHLGFPQIAFASIVERQ